MSQEPTNLRVQIDPSQNGSGYWVRLVGDLTIGVPEMEQVRRKSPKRFHTFETIIASNYHARSARGAVRLGNKLMRQELRRRERVAAKRRQLEAVAL